MSRKTSPARRAAFLKALSETGNQTIAAERAKVSRSWVQLHRSTDPAFDADVPGGDRRGEGAGSRGGGGAGAAVRLGASRRGGAGGEGQRRSGAAAGCRSRGRG